MTDLEDMDVDEFVEQVAEQVKDDIELPEPDVPEVPDDLVDQETVQEIAGATVQEQLEHLVHDDCDTPACNALRDEFGFSPGDDEETDETGTESVESEETETDEGNESSSSDQTDESEPDSGESSTDSPETDDGPAHAAFPDEF